MLDRTETGRAAALSPTMSGSTLLRLEEIGLLAGAHLVLKDIDLAIAPGPPTVLLGPNGAGKTSVLRLAMGLAKPTRGRIIEAAGLRKAIVLQRPVMLRRSAAANLAYACVSAGRPASSSEVARLLDIVGLGHAARRPARLLSGGEQQRLALARALAAEPQLLLLDEPTASLDPAAMKAVEDIIARIADEGVKIVLATHDLGQARRLAGDVVLLVGGRIAERAAAPAFFTAPATDAARRFLAGELVLEVQEES